MFICSRFVKTAYIDLFAPLYRVLNSKLYIYRWSLSLSRIGAHVTSTSMSSRCISIFDLFSLIFFLDFCNLSTLSTRSYFRNDIWDTCVHVSQSFLWQLSRLLHSPIFWLIDRMCFKGSCMTIFKNVCSFYQHL